MMKLVKFKILLMNLALNWVNNQQKKKKIIEDAEKNDKNDQTIVCLKCRFCWFK